MKKYIIICTALFGMSFLGHAQVGIGTKNPSPSALLEVTSKDGNQGVILLKIALTSLTSFAPLMDKDKEGRDMKVDPRNLGLIVYNTTVNKTAGLSAGFYYWTGATWTKVTDTELLKTTITEEIKKVVPTDDKGKSSFVIFNKDAAEGNGKGVFFTVEKTANEVPVISAVDFKSLVERDETATKIQKRDGAEVFTDATT
ncbi:hypothetical protein VSO92_07265 [Myroides pelagicus]|uniref:hypothetical protein n=1 Tax=Myroides pelagicus TaxID=270914 RepID=UPI002DB6B3D2|nr:hypothetical protein [Myroides pelagicus]MEC4113902.1 hypothetical protein [Myroides pelagicus]